MSRTELPLTMQAWDFDRVRKAAAKDLSNQHYEGYEATRIKGPGSQNEKDSIAELVPAPELQSFTLLGEFKSSRFFHAFKTNRDLALGIISVLILLITCSLLGLSEAMQATNYNRLIPEKYMSDRMIARHKWESWCIYGFTAGLGMFAISFHLSARWRLEVERDIELAVKRREEFLSFDDEAL